MGQALNYLRDVFSLTPDFVRDVALTLLTFLIGWMSSVRVSKRRLKNRIVDELLLSQRELIGRAYPETRQARWKANDGRDAWMLDPFVARIKFLIASLSEEKSLDQKQLSLLENYVVALQDFIAEWARTWARRDVYHYKYRVTYNTLRSAVTALGLTQLKRLNGLLPASSLLERAKEPQLPPRSSTTANEQVKPLEDTKIETE